MGCILCDTNYFAREWGYSLGGRVDLETLEHQAYRASWSDGIIDVYVGLALLWIGATWIWLPDLAGVAGVLPAVMLAPALAARQRFLEPRLGYVRWRAPRRLWERRALQGLLAAGVALFAGGLLLAILPMVATDGPLSLDMAPGVLAWLLTLLAVGLAVALSAWRMSLYAAVLATSGAIVVGVGANPGWPLLACGAVAGVVGSVMLLRFIRRHR